MDPTIAAGSFCVWIPAACPACWQYPLNIRGFVPIIPAACPACWQHPLNIRGFVPIIPPGCPPLWQGLWNNRLFWPFIPREYPPYWQCALNKTRSSTTIANHMCGGIITLSTNTDQSNMCITKTPETRLRGFLTPFYEGLARWTGCLQSLSSHLQM